MADETLSAADVPAQTNPLSRFLLLAGAALCVGAIGYDDADQLTAFPGWIVLVAGILTGLCALAGLLAASAPTDRIALLLGAVLFGYMANDVVLVLKFSSESGVEFEGAIVVATVGCVALLLALLSSFLNSGAPRATTPDEPRRQRASGTSAQAGTAVAPAGWYPDPGGGPGQRYWDGEQWGQTSG